MKLLSVCSFLLLTTFAAGLPVGEKLQSCIRVADYASWVNPGGICAYFEDAVRCAIIDWGLMDDNVTEAEIETGRVWANNELQMHNCEQTFDAILDEVKAKPELLEMQDCFIEATEKGYDNPFRRCDYVEEAVRCSIQALEIHGVNASGETLQFAKEMSTRYLTLYDCEKTFDEILNDNNNNENSITTVSSTGQDSRSDCLDTLMDSMSRNPDATCQNYEDYVRCIIQEFDMLRFNPTQEQLERLERYVNEPASLAGCHVDFIEIYNEMKREADAAETGGTMSNVSLSGQDGAGFCLNKLKNNLTRNPDTSCVHYEDYIKCIIQVTGFMNSDVTLGDLESAGSYIYNMVNNQLSLAGCHVDLSEIFNAMKREADTDAVGQGLPIPKTLPYCILVTSFKNFLNPGSTCAYIESVVRCIYIDWLIALRKVSRAEAEAGRNWANQELDSHHCESGVDAIVRELREEPELRELDECLDDVTWKDSEIPSKRCEYVEKFVRCIIEALNIHEESASDETLQFGRDLSIRHLTHFARGCIKTFDEILNEMKQTDSNSAAVSPTGWLITVMVSFIVMFKTLF